MYIKNICNIKVGFKIDNNINIYKVFFIKEVESYLNIYFKFIYIFFLKISFLFFVLDY